MSRRFLRPLFSFWENMSTEAYISKKSIPGGSKANKQYYKTQQKEQDPHETFDNFYKNYYENTSNLKKQEKEFFQKHYPQKVGKKFNPFQVLGVQENSDLEKVKQSYRSNAIKYHPKNDPTPDGQKKFKDLARAYNAILQKRQTDDYGQDNSSKSFFQDFHNKIDQLDQNEASEAKSKEANIQKDSSQKEQGKVNFRADQKKDQSKTQQNNQDQKKQQNYGNNVKSQNKKQNTNKDNQKSTKQFLRGAQLYSQSSYFEFVNGKRKLHVTKMYQKDGKTFKVDRIEDHRNDGTIQVIETLDDGKQVKQKKFIQGASKKQNQIGN